MNVILIGRSIMTKKKDTRKYHDWVYMADDQMNKVLKTVIVLVFTYGFFVAITDIWENL